MNRTSNMRLISVFFFAFCSIGSWAQLVKVPIVKNSHSQKKNANTRVEQLSAIELPFWDDFSFTNGKDYPNDSLWQYGHSVWVNDGMAINPPTIKVGTFDGIDSLGLPYNINSAIAKGVADKLVSRPLRLDLIDPLKRDLVFIFFYYQYEGNGEQPDPGDELSLWFKNDSTEWNKVWSVDVDSTSDNTKFVPVKLQIGDLLIPGIWIMFMWVTESFSMLRNLAIFLIARLPHHLVNHFFSTIQCPQSISYPIPIVLWHILL
jgi:hypothetical protein